MQIVLVCGMYMVSLNLCDITLISKCGRYKITQSSAKARPADQWVHRVHKWQKFNIQ